MNRPTTVPLPPKRLPLLRDRRLLKRWRYVGGYTEELMFCVLSAQVGPFRQGAWAVLDRHSGQFFQQTKFGRNGVTLSDARIEVESNDIRLELLLEETPGIEVVTPAGRSYTWTRKQLAQASGFIKINGSRRELAQTVLVDDSAGYHPRHTSWRWSAGFGRSKDGKEVAWNLVAGINDSPLESERTIWIDGEPTEIGPVIFDHDLRGLEFEGDEQLAFKLENERARSDNLIVIRSRYRQPFGSFSGRLPLAGELAEGFGVMESHEAVW